MVVAEEGVSSVEPAVRIPRLVCRISPETVNVDLEGQGYRTVHGSGKIGEQHS